MTDCAILRFRVLLLVLWLLSAAPPAARSAAAASDEKSPAVKTESDSDSATKAEDATKADPAQRRSEEEYFELFRSLADTIDQVDRNYVKPIDRREIMERS